MPLDLLRFNEADHARKSLMAKLQQVIELSSAEERELELQLRDATLDELRAAEAQLFPPVVRGVPEPDFRDDHVPWTTTDNGGGLSGRGIHNGSDRVPLSDDNFNAVVTHLRAQNEVLKNRLVEVERKLDGVTAQLRAQNHGRISGV